MDNPTVISPERLSTLEPLIRRYAGSTVLNVKGQVSLGDGEGTRAITGLLIRGFVEGKIEAVGIEHHGEIVGALLWRKLPWDTKVLGKACARIFLIGGCGLDRILAFWKERAASMGIRYVTVRLPQVGEMIADESREEPSGEEDGHEKLPLLLVDVGFERVERLIFFKRSTAAPAPYHSITEARKGDRDEIFQIAGSAYSFDRFHRESFFTKGEADRLHKAWAAESFSGRADAILVVRDEGKHIAGYCTCTLPADRAASPGWIDMLAVRDGQRRRGFGESLILAALRYFRRNGLKEAALSTQETNHSGIGLYGKLGFMCYGIASTYRLVLETHWTPKRDG